MILKRSEKYLSTLLGACLEIGPGDELVVLLPEEYRDFSELLCNEAYKRGAKKVYLNFEDEHARYIYYKNGSTEPYRWLSQETFEKPAEHGAKMLLIISPHFGLFEKLDPKQYELCMAHYYMDAGMRGAKILRNDAIPHTAAMLPNVYWAKKLFPELSEEEAFDALWERMGTALYLDRDDPEQYWKEHSRELYSRAEKLTSMAFDKLCIKGEGTDISMELPENHIWIGGTMVSAGGCEYIPQIPTEEIFTAPHINGVNGGINIRTGSFFRGSYTPGLKIAFADGELESLTSDAPEFAGSLLSVISANDGGNRLGEIALVCADSGVKAADCFFFHNLFDENKCSHMAFGHAYRFSIADGEGMSDDEFRESGGNVCTFHHDIMFDSENMSVSAYKNGIETAIMTEGRWEFFV